MAHNHPLLVCDLETSGIICYFIETFSFYPRRHSVRVKVRVVCVSFRVRVKVGLGLGLRLGLYSPSCYCISEVCGFGGYRTEVLVP